MTLAQPQLDFENITTHRLADCEAIIERGIKTFVDVGNALLEIRDNRLYRDNYSTFEDYCRERWGWGRNYVNKQISAAEVVKSLGTIVPILPSAESQARPLVSLPPDRQAEAWRLAVETAPEGRVTAAHVQSVVERITRPENIHVSDDSYEWYTPAEYIESARRVMGAIDLDPASCKEANDVVKADRFYTKDDDGLTRDWFGKVWLNPPYNMPDIESFTARIHDVYVSKEIESAIVLVNNSTDSRWFHTLLFCYPVCFTRGRVKYYGPHASQARQGQAIFYLGNDVEKFAREFSQYGIVVKRYDNK